MSKEGVHERYSVNNPNNNDNLAGGGSQFDK
jgi:hypothetical protein